MNIHDWIKSKIKYLKPLNEYPVGKFLPFKSKNGYYMYLDTIVDESVHIYYYTDLSSDAKCIKFYIVQNDNTITPPHLEPFTVDGNNRYEYT